MYVKEHLVYLFELGSTDDKTHKKLPYCLLVPALGNSLRDCLLCGAENEISIFFFFHGDIDQDRPSVKRLDGNSIVSASYGA